MVQENLRPKPFLKVLLFIFLWGTKSMCYFSISDCYIKMSWHMCLKCKIYKKEKIHLMLMIFYFYPFFMVQKVVLSLLFMTKFICHLFIDTCGECPPFYLGREGTQWSSSRQAFFQVLKGDFSSSTSCERLLDFILDRLLFSYSDVWAHLYTKI